MQMISLVSIKRTLTSMQQEMYIASVSGIYVHRRMYHT